MVGIHCNPAQHCELRTPANLWIEHIEPKKSLLTKNEGVGAPIGRLSSQHAMGLYINDIVRWLNEDCLIHTVVFVDDMTLVVEERHHDYALSLIPVIRRKMAKIGLKLNEKKFYDQPYYHGLELLGSHIKTYRLHLNNRSYERGLSRVDEFNAMAERKRNEVLPMLICSMNSYTGMLKNRTDYKRLVSLCDGLDDGWKKRVVWNKDKICLNVAPKYDIRRFYNHKYNIHLKIA